jgi:diguanylate cyclase (GGDEF)-like protein
VDFVTMNDERLSLRGRFSTYVTVPIVAFLVGAPQLAIASGLTHRPFIKPADVYLGFTVAIAYVCFARFSIRTSVGELNLTYTATELPLLVGVLFLHPVAHILIRLFGTAIGTMWRVRRNKSISTLGAGLGNGALGMADVATFSAVLAGLSWSGVRQWRGLAALGLAWTVYVFVNQLMLVSSRYFAGQTITKRSIRSSLTNGVELSLATLGFGVLLAIGHSVTHALIALGIVLLVARPLRVVMSHLAEGDQYRALDQFFTLLQKTDSSNVEGALELVSEATKCRSAELVIIEREGLDRSLDSALMIGNGSRRTMGVSELPANWRAVLDTRVVTRDELDGSVHSIICPLIVSESAVGLLVCSDPFDTVHGITPMIEGTATRLSQNLSLWLEQDRLLNELRRDMEERTQQAIRDPLTGLLNRRGLAEAWEKRTQGDDGVAVFLIDLDNFKEVNSFVGHDGGDRVLIEAANRLRRVLPPRAEIARIGGDEFAVILPGIRRRDNGKDCSDVGQLGVQVRAALSSPHHIGGNEVSLAGSIGVSLYPQHGSDLGVLLRNADAALFSAKDDTDSGVAVFANATYGHDPKDVMIDGYRLKAAIDNGDIHVYFQPIIDMHTFNVVGFEALARWKEAGRMVMPQQFIALAEKTGHVHALTERVMCEAFSQLVRWREITGRDLYVGVNISPTTISHPGTFAALEAALKRTGLDPAAVFLEVTESRMFRDPLHATIHLNHLRTTGVNVSLDDFGTGASTHEWLMRMAPNQIKIDRMFIKDMIEDDRAAGIVELDVQTGLKFKASVVAEGIETAAHWHKAKSLGVPFAQGYLMSRPKPANEILDWLTHEEPQLEHLIALADSLSPTSSDLGFLD